MLRVRLGSRSAFMARWGGVSISTSFLRVCLVRLLPQIYERVERYRLDGNRALVVAPKLDENPTLVTRDFQLVF